ncbi:MAG TPA: biopolymer transporter Tol, partial [Pseudobdellovibrionaceae bacterium]|nr:biopolymer transporter Tol [Pseudobdellovibrionaceae bacterium]
MMKTYLLLLSAVALAKPSAAPQAKFLDQPNTLIRNSRQLTFVGPRSGEGYFSADGTKMIFQGEREGGNPFYQMFILDLKTGKTNRVSTGQGKTTCGWIHPSGKKVMWSSTHLDKGIPEKVKQEYEGRKNPVKSRYSWSYDEHFDIFESDLQGKKIKRLTREKGYDAEGSYSPDGKWIAFASNRDGYTAKLSDEDRKLFERDPSYMMDIYIMKSDGTGVKRLTDSKGYDGGPFFSADGKKITWRRFNAEGSKAEIFTMNVDGSDQKQVTRLGSMSWAPYYHPSGDYIIFASSVLGYANFELFIVDSAGLKDPVRVSFDDGFDGLAAFSPDGNTLTWTHRNEKGESQIMLADWDDVQARRLLGLPPQSIRPQSLAKEIRESDLRQLVGWLAS